jgi:hypothetical protein
MQEISRSTVLGDMRSWRDVSRVGNSVDVSRRLVDGQL